MSSSSPVGHSGSTRRQQAKQGRASAVARAAYSACTEALEARTLLAGNVVVDEIMYHAASQNPADEWLELYNPSPAPVDLGGWHFNKGISFTFAPGTTIGAGQYLVVARDLARFQSNYPGVTNVVGGWQGSLGNNGDTIELDDATGNPEQRLSYGSEGDWALRRRSPLDLGYQGWMWTTPADGGGSSMELVNSALPNDSGQNWAPSTAAGGTPGAANSVQSSNIAPEVLDLTQTPLIPKSNESVTITARIVDEQTAGVTAALHWRVDGAASFTTVPMFDDGAHGDGAASDGVFGAVIPPQADNTVIEFYTSATDASNLTRTWPAPTDAAGTQGANLLYQVDDSSYTGNQPLLKLIMTNAERQELAALSSPGSPSKYSNATMNGTFISVDGTGAQVRYTIGIRNRGGGSRDTLPNNYRVNINNDDLWNKLRAIDLNGSYSANDVAGSAIMRAAGVPAQRVVPVKVRVNNADLAAGSSNDVFDSYSFVEAENSDMAAEHFPTDPNGNYYRGVDPNHHADLSYLGTNPASYSTLYPKQTNSELNDYTDLINLIKAFDPTQTPDANFVSTISQNINVNEWIRYFAANSLIGNEETALATGVGDDFSLYRGLIDPHFQVICHDLDTILGIGDSPQLVNPNESIFKATSLPVVSRFLKNPAFAPLYYAALKDLALTTFSAPQINATLDNTLKGYVPQTVIDSMKAFAASRVAGVLAQIPQTLTATTTLPVQNGYAYTTTATAALSGQADVIGTRSILVNGAPAQWTAWQGTWSAPSVALHPGINRVLVQSLDGAGHELSHTYVDIWRDTGVTTAVSGTLPAGLTHWTVAGAPYHVTSTVTVPAGGVLQIDPGVTVFFDAGTGLTVNGRIDAQGTAAQRIVFARTPTAASAWDRILVTNTQDDGRIAYATMENAGSGGENVQVINSRLDTDHMEWLGTTTHIVDYVNSAFRLTNSIIPTVVGVEPAHFLGMPANGYALVQGNVWGTTTGHNDIFDFTGGARPGPIFQVLDNIFLGTGTNGVAADDILDIDGTDAHVEGNLFMNVIHSPMADTNSAMSGGNYDYGSGPRVSNVVSERNIFYNCDQAIMMKEGNFFSSINDTIVGTETAAFVFDEPGFAAGPGHGGFVDGDIIYNAPHLYANINDSGSTTQFNVRDTLFQGTPYPGSGNLSGDPQFTNLSDIPGIPAFAALALGTNTADVIARVRADLALQPSSPAVGTGPNGRDMGAVVPAGASIAGEPAPTTYVDSATLTVGGPDILAYKYRVNNGPWSGEIATLNPLGPNASIPPIQLTGLAPGTYTVYVARKNSAGFWQADADATASKTWTVDPNWSRLVINEVLADNATAVIHNGSPDLIELYNDSASSRDLSGMSLTDDPARPRKFVFPAGTVMGPGEYLVVYGNNPDGSSGIHIGFGMKASGEELHLYDAPANGGAELDSVVFGQQLTDLSIGRLPNGTWGLTNPTFGSANIAHSVGDSRHVKINEWLASGVAPFPDDYIELYNPDAAPVNVGGMYLSDQPAGWPNRSQITPLSFIPATGYNELLADGSTGGNHVNFKLSSVYGEIGLADANLHPIDRVVYGSQSTGISQGRTPDGGPDYQFFSQPNPGLPNPSTPPPSTQTYNLFPITAAWRYNQSGDQGTAWSATAFNDSSWTSGFGLLYNETDPLPAPKNTPLTLGKTTYYFRRHFTLPVAPSTLNSFQLQTVLDDGAVVYINGHEVFRLGMPTGPVTYATFASRGVTNAVYEGPFDLPTTWLVQGDNVIAVEVHQVNATSSDIVWGGVLTATANVNQTQTPVPLRVTEINYNPPGGGAYTPDDYEFIELKNVGADPLDLTGMRLAAAVNFTFPAMTLAPGQDVVVVKNEAAFIARYGTGINIAGVYTDTLSNTGEEIRVLAADNSLIQDFTYSNQWYPSTDGNGDTLTINNSAADPATWGSAASWRPSKFILGSPGTEESATPVDSVVINELVSHSHAAAGDWIELHNTTAAPIDISGWYLSDSASNLQKFRIADGTVIPANGYLVLTELNDFGNAANPGAAVPFAFSEAGDSAYLSAASAPGVLSGYRAGVTFGGAATDVPFGRYTTSTNRVDFVAQASPTPGAANGAPAVGPVVINEVMYHPGGTSDEFIELHNLTSQAVPLFDPANPADVWRLNGGVSFDFPSDASIPASGYALVVPTDPAAFRAKYGIPASVPIFGPYTGALSNSGERISLEEPGAIETGVPLYYIQEDQLTYGSTAPWPTSPDGTGPSLGRISSGAYGDDVANWAAEGVGGSPGRPNFGGHDAASVMGRFIFYNSSKFDGNSAGADSRDDAAIATDKQALLPGQTATLANFTSYSRGINGIMIDIANVPGDTQISINDFIFKVGNSSTPGTWTDAPAPTLSYRAGAGVGGSGRFELTWADNVIQKQWLQITVKADANTGLTAPDVFYFGNAIADSGAGDSATLALVNATDEIGARNDPHNFLNPAPITNIHDYNRDGKVDATDQILSRNNGTNFLNALKLFTTPSASAAAQALTLSAAALVQAPSTGAGTKGLKVLQKPSHRLALDLSK